MIKEVKKIPKYYLEKIPMCDECNIELIITGIELLCFPSRKIYQCTSCAKQYYFSNEELQGKWIFEEEEE